MLEYSKFLLSLFFLLFSTLAISQINYYFSTSGSDLNDGMSESTPWKTTNKFNNTQFGYGDIIHFKKGDVWEKSHLFLDSGITIKSYGSLTNRPIISNLDYLELDWYIHSEEEDTIYKADVPNIPNIERLIVNDSERLKSTLFEDIGEMSVGIDYTETKQEWFFDLNEQVLYLVSDIHPSNLSIKTSLRYYTVSGYEVDDVVIQDIEIQGGFGPSIQIIGCNDITVKNCTIGRNSGSGILAKDNSSNIIIKDNIINSGWPSNLAYGVNSTGNDLLSSKRGVQDGVIFVGGVTNSHILNNRISNWGHTGIEFIGENHFLAGVNNNHVSSNVITAENMSYGRAIGIDGISDKCRSNVFRYNLIKDCKTQIQFNGNNNRFHHNIVMNTKNSPCRSLSRVGKGMELSVYGNSFVCSSIRVDNNLFINNDSYAISIDNYYTNASVSNIYIRNNIMINNNIDDEESNAALYIADKNSIVDIRIFNNLFYDFHDTNYDDFINYRGNIVNINNITPYQNQNDQIDNNYHEDPLFDSQNYFELNNNSPCIDNGVSVEYSDYANDYDGDIFPYHSMPDIGPQEYQGALIERKQSFLKRENVELKDKIIVYPNPTKDFIHIKSFGEILGLKLFDLNGKKIEVDISDFVLNTSKLSKGIYFLVIENIDGTYIEKIVKY